MSNLPQDLRFGFRMLLKSPGFALIAVLSLALGVAANTATFSVVNAVILRPYAFPDLEKLVLVRPALMGKPTAEQRLTPADYEELASRHEVFQGTAAFRFSDFNLARGGEVDAAEGYSVSPELFSLVGASALRGRTFQPEEAQPGRNSVVILSYGLWQRRFGGDAAVLGSTVAVDGENCTVVGIMPEHFNYPLGVEMWKPLALTPEERTDHAHATVYMLARLAPAMSLNSAGGAISSLGARLEREFPATNAGRGFSLLRLRQEQYQYTVPMFLLLQCAAVFVLALACANLLNLLLIRALTRRRELAVRAALGASRLRLVQLFTSETVLLAAIAATGAVLASVWSVQAIRDSLSPNYTKWLAGWQAMRLDSYTLVIGLSLAMAMALLLGVISGLAAARMDPQEGLKEGGRTSGGLKESRTRGILVISQLAIAITLLVGSGLMIAGFERLQSMFASLDPQHVLAFGISLPESRYPSASKVNEFYDRVLSGVSVLPGARAVGMITNHPASNVDSSQARFTIEGRPEPRAAEMPFADRQFVSSGALSLLGVPQIEGRILAETDGALSPKVAVISRSLAKQYWPAQSAVNQRIRFSSGDQPVTIVGVVGELRINWYDQAARPTIYLPYSQGAQRRFTFLVRTAGSPADLAEATRQVAWNIDPGVSLTSLRPYTREVDESIAPIRIMALLILVFGMVSLALAAMGVYGVVAHNVVQRRREFGIRMALGAGRQDVLRLVVNGVLRLTGVGWLVGLVLAVIAMKLTASLVFGLMIFNVGVFGLVSAIILAMALLAAVLPARAAARVDPADALKAE